MCDKMSKQVSKWTQGRKQKGVSNRSRGVAMWRESNARELSVGLVGGAAGDHGLLAGLQQATVTVGGGGSMRGCRGAGKGEDTNWNSG